jgi:hypothetical protein
VRALGEFTKVSGIKAAAAKKFLCNLLADRKIQVRAMIAADMFDGVRTVVDQNIEVPSHLKPNDFDWKASRPLSPWSIGPRWWIADERYAFARRLRLITQLDLRAIDIAEWAEKFSKKTKLGDTNNRNVLRSQNEKKYKERLSAFTPGRYPTRHEDEEWGRQHHVSRERVRELRRQLLPEEIQKGGAPKKVPKSKLGQK